ncbi:chaperone protein dnaJ 49-like [Magnolia sinica]|uniref:chaperone protein dnaJ 49-like n=1 Tax=Magnolia sinica TaxID=86752 RepID=UPI002659FBA6|nr:chaperone protein dnaJ 49-like [Magnolia sinica]XP_058113192.1 chaperone protein dnaJ 49-like [Magnolia sinica]XP_058113195.1 chaperone protein dnaJ 49-like [Magnolia sinica]XP_058113197.1 chaperone protein dnaJ 49-like [Magnolia sinica]
MDGNKDEALKCLRIGKESLESGDRNRALKFLTKARRLDPTLPIDDLISTIDSDSPNDNPPPPTDPTTEAHVPNKPPGNSSSVRARVSANGPSPSPSSSSSSSSYTEEQISIVRQIKRKKDYYEILGVEKECSVEDVRKAYRKLSLKVHPDKNKAPGAEEAFKAVSKAFQCLSDGESRKRYDLVGSEEEVVYERRARRGSHNGFNGFYEGEVDAEEIFRNFFFGGGMPPATASFGTFRFGQGMGPSAGRNGEAHGSGNTNLRALIQILPIIVLLLLNFLPSSEPVYSLSRSHAYQYQFVTEKGVQFYVRTSKFEEEYPIHSPERTALEERVERDYASVLTQNCRVELQRRQWGLAYQIPHCDLLKEFEARA